jgi:uncharacterized protein YraI
VHVKFSTSIWVIVGATLWTSLALASNAYTKGEVNLRAGPSAEYPLVLQIPANAFVNVDGCVDDWTWCDVDWEGNRGWVYANYLLYDVDNRRVPIIDNGPRLGLTIVVFSVNDYWGRYYVRRPWYRDRDIWVHRPMPPRRPPPRPRPPVVRPPPRPQRPQPPRPPRPEVRPPRPAVRPLPPNPRPAIARPAPVPAGPAVRPAPGSGQTNDGRPGRRDAQRPQ